MAQMQLETNQRSRNNNVKYTARDGIGVDCCVDVNACDTSTCTGGLIADNIVSFSFRGDDLIDVDGSNLTVQKNVLLFSPEVGLDYNGNNSTIAGNVFKNCGAEERLSDSAIEINGNGNVIEMEYRR